MKKPGAGPRSKISKQQVFEAVRRHIVGREKLIHLAREMGISCSYLARLIKTATDPESGWVRVHLSSDLTPEILDTRAVLKAAKGQIASVVDGKRVCFVIDTSRAAATFQQMTIGDVSITIIVSVEEGCS